MIVVSDASPLISLAATGYLEILQQLYEQVIIPEAVYQEITGSVSGLPGASEVQTLAWIIAQPVQNHVDEQRARVVATRLGLNVVGVLGVLVEAKHKSLVPRLKPILDDLITRAGFRVSPQLYEQVLQAVGESP